MDAYGICFRWVGEKPPTQLLQCITESLFPLNWSSFHRGNSFTGQVAAPLLPVLQEAEENGNEGFVRTGCLFCFFLPWFLTKTSRWCLLLNFQKLEFLTVISEISTRDCPKLNYCVTQKTHSNSLSVVCQRFVVSHRIHVRFIYLHLVNFHGKEIPYMDPVAIDMFFVSNNHNHRTFQVPKMEVLTYIRCMDTAYGYGKFPPLPK